MNNNTSVFDVATTFLTYDSMTHKKLQKLCYYAKAWHLALFNKPLFEEKFQAWVHGPVCRELYDEYKSFGWQYIEKSKKGQKIVNPEEIELLQAVYDTYGDFSGDDLEVLTHSELPWLEIRGDLEEWEPSKELINEETMKDFYFNIYEKGQND